MLIVGEYFKEYYILFSDFHTTVSREKEQKYFLKFFDHSSN